MPKVAVFICYAVAFVCFALATFQQPRNGKVSLIGLGLAAWVLVPLWNAWPG